jgi:hypothetical protein
VPVGYSSRKKEKSHFFDACEGKELVKATLVAGREACPAVVLIAT